MALNLQTPILYLITSGETTPRTKPHSPEFTRLLNLVRAATLARIPLIQLREKNLSASVLYDLATQSAQLIRGSATRIVVNDRADIAHAAGCDGVHLRASSLDASTVRRSFGKDLLIGVSTHSIEEARAARLGQADFAVFGPVFDTPSKRAYGPALGLEKLEGASRELAPFPILAIGGITRENSQQVMHAGASGIAAIRLFSETENLEKLMQELGERHK